MPVSGRRTSLTARLTLLFAAASTVVLLVLGWIVAGSVEHHFEEQDMAELNGRLVQVGRLLDKLHSAAELDGALRQLEDSLVGHHGITIAVLGPDGVIHSAGHGAAFPVARLGSGPADGLPQVWEDEGSAYRGLVAPVATGIPGVPTLRVGVATDIAHHRSFMDSFMRTLWWVVLGASLATGLLGWFAARRGLAPLRAMGHRAGEVSAQRLDHRLPADTVPAELAELADSLNDMLARLEESFRRLSDFSSDLAHELRTPVSNLMTQTQVALTRARDADAYREVLESNAEEFDRLSRMIGDMLFLAKAENGLIVPGLAHFPLADEVSALFEFYGAVAEDNGVTLRLSGRADVAGDRLMLRRAIGNLLSNALRHTPEGGTVTATVAPAVDESGRPGVRLAIANTGEPIPAEHLPRLFDRFYQADAARRHGGEGAGLGLAITRSILRAHGGDVTARVEGGQNVFEMWLPLAD